MSKAVLSLQKSKVFQRAIMFAVINPQSNGAGFARVKINVTFEDIDGKEGILLQCKAKAAQLTGRSFLLTASFLD